MFNTIRQTAELLSTTSVGDGSALLNADHGHNIAQFTSLKATGDSFVDGYMGYVSYRKQLDPFAESYMGGDSDSIKVSFVCSVSDSGEVHCPH
mmetsp:Transcript_50618/g.105743  ORF Transcript_50618/g.105743 Transcript_50618/m.105743 type:complete len:93 (+) Transcript_50618:21-299(+)|eukprot:CAMPEP_0172151298 /NCGR_PEP_ID=MMETSP1050-20130122/149_1 /TAXON_ID=233186 /ORGANISM="Cryptomonas curvata, Strain CCAP979/52" /LENGTH=92 /DNA_ID=CAMNT_0012819383 /DNA_START=10 /DNA_END=288 /DNA_ORIENTATION=+